MTTVSVFIIKKTDQYGDDDKVDYTLISLCVAQKRGSDHRSKLCIPYSGHWMCGSRKYPYPPQGWSLEIPKGSGDLKGQNYLKEGMKLNCNFQRGGGIQTKIPSLGGVPGGGGALGYFFGGYVPPGIPNWHPVLKKIPPKLIPRSRNGPVSYIPF